MSAPPRNPGFGKPPSCFSFPRLQFPIFGVHITHQGDVGEPRPGCTNRSRFFASDARGPPKQKCPSRETGSI